MDGTHGYVHEYAADHPRATCNGFVLQHRLVMECVLQRLLLPTELVHHEDRVRCNNQPWNLALTTRQDHQRDHHPERRGPTISEAQVREALVGRTTQQAADYLGVTDMTIRRYYDHLLTKRRSPGAPLAPEIAARVAALAADPTIGTRRAAAELGVTPMTLRAWCEREGIAWTAAPTGRPKPRPR